MTIRGARLSPLMEVRMRWKVTSNGSFSVKSLYNDLSSRRAGLFPHGLIWNPSVPSKVCFFAWEASWGKVLTMDQLKKRGWAVANRCFLCCEEEESIDHILIHCSKLHIAIASSSCLSAAFAESSSSRLLGLSKSEAIPVGECPPWSPSSQFWDVRLDVYLLPTWVFPLEPPTNPLVRGMQWKKDSGKDCLSGKGNTFPKVAV
ncbi:hypothetical protein CK203_079440 [Vitis vinifera]|uniref:Reverse transcriptase zinc-binding domain-containing protein n=1 Tax=Vitis vinifera TaxID=29760 RepID=A0A438BSA7_VITVI|nr:hypothetical protein CK203_079440 [Vitis vinifera]